MRMQTRHRKSNIEDIRQWEEDENMVKVIRISFVHDGMVYNNSIHKSIMSKNHRYELKLSIRIIQIFLAHSLEHGVKQEQA